MTAGVGPQLTRLLDTHEPAPASLIDLHFDFVAWNRPFATIWAQDALPVDRCNLRWLYFAKDTAACTSAGWQERGHRLLSQFRAVAAEHPADARFAELVEALTNTSDPFAARWADNRVEKALTVQIAIRRPPVGIIRLDVTELTVAAQPSLTLCIQVPSRDTNMRKFRQIT